MDKIILELDKMDDIDRLIVSLYFGFIDSRIYGQSEIAKKIGLSQGQVSKRLSRTLKQIRSSLGVVNEKKIIKKIA